MLKKIYRLKKYSAIIATYKQKNIISDSNICIYLGKEKTKPDIPTKIAFIVSKKVHKRAVVRNRIKRFMRESFRLLQKKSQALTTDKYISVVCTAKEKTVDASFKEIDNSFNNLMLKIK